MLSARMKKVLGKAMTGLLAAALLLQAVGVVALAEETLEVATLTDATPVGGLLAGSTAGSFAYYQVEYPGDSVALEIQVTFGEHDPTISPQLGVNLYTADGLAMSGVEKEDGAYEAVSYAAEEATMLTVQVYNYSETTVAYSVTALGLPEAVAEETVAAVDETVTEVADTTQATAASLATGIEGSITGSAAGAFDRHSLSYAGDGTTVTVTFSVWPLDPSYASAVGFTVYDPEGVVVARGANTDTHGVLAASFASEVAGDYTVAIHNYAEGIAVSYTLTAM